MCITTPRASHSDLSQFLDKLRVSWRLVPHSSGSEPVVCRAPREDPNQLACQSFVSSEPQSTLQLKPPSVQQAPRPQPAQPFPCKTEPVLKWRLELRGSVQHEAKSLRKACCLRILKPIAAFNKPFSVQSAQSGIRCRKRPLGETLPTMLLRLLRRFGLTGA